MSLGWVFFVEYIRTIQRASISRFQHLILGIHQAKRNRERSWDLTVQRSNQVAVFLSSSEKRPQSYEDKVYADPTNLISNAAPYSSLLSDWGLVEKSQSQSGDGKAHLELYRISEQRLLSPFFRWGNRHKVRRLAPHHTANKYQHPVLLCCFPNTNSLPIWAA